MIPHGSLFWYAIHTKPQQEQRAAENLDAWGIEVLLPRLAERSWHQILKPLFPRYLFARFDATSMTQKVNLTRGISHVVAFGGKPAVVDDEIIEVIRRRSDRDMVIYYPVDLAPGDTVQIVRGPMQNLVGVLEKKLNAAERVRMLLIAVAYTARVEVAATDVFKMPSAS